MLWIKRKSETLIIVLLSLFIVWIAGNGLTNYGDAKILVATQPKWVFFCMSIIAMLTLCLGVMAGYKLLQSASYKTLRILSVLSPVLMLILQGYIVFGIRGQYLWDAAFVVGAANYFKEHAQIVEEAKYYMSVYPNQNTFLLITVFFLKIADFLKPMVSDPLIVLNCINVVFLDISVFFIYLLAKKRIPLDEKYKRVGVQLILLCTPFFYVQVSNYYTMTLSLPFCLGLLLVFCKLEEMAGLEEDNPSNSMRVKKILMSLLGGLLFGVGYMIRPTTIIFLLAGILVSVLFSLKHKRIKTLILQILIVVIGFAIIWGLTGVQKKVIGLDTRNTEFPTSHWIMMSLSGNGEHNEADEAFTASFSTKEEKVLQINQRIKEKLNELGPKGYLTLLGRKTLQTFVSGNMGTAFYQEYGLYTNRFYPYLFGEKKDAMIIYQQVLYIVCLLAILARMIRQRKKEKEFMELLLQLSILGGLIFYLIWETSPRYGSLFYPLILLLAVYEIEPMFRFMENKIKGKPIQLNAIYAIAVLSIGIFWLWNSDKYTQTPREKEIPVVVQVLANQPFEVSEDKVFRQVIKPSRSFNRLLFQWRNQVGSENTAVYKITFRRNDEQMQTIFEEELIARGQANQGAFDKIFALEQPDQRGYVLEIKKIKGNPKDSLSFVVFDMGGYDAYPIGESFLNQNPVNKDLLLLVSRQAVEPYFTRKEYWAMGLLWLFFFLFPQFCCKLMKMLKFDLKDD